MKERLSETWLSAVYAGIGEINTGLSYVAVNEPEFFAQGEEADKIIEEICNIWNNEDLTTRESFTKWISLNL